MYMQKQTTRRYINLVHQVVLSQARTIVEIGVCNAINAEHMLRAAIQYNADEPSDIVYHGFDLFEEGIENIVDEAVPQKGELSRPLPIHKVIAKLKKLGVNYRLLPGSTFDTLSCYVEEAIEVDAEYPDLIFIDAGHSHASVANDWYYARKLMGPGTVVLFDDYFSGGHVKEGGEWGVSAVVDAIDRSKYTTEILYPNDILQPPQDVTNYTYVPIETKDPFDLPPALEVSIIKVTKRP